MEKPLDALWVFGKPTQPLNGFAQAGITLADGRATVAATPEVNIELFGDPADVELTSQT